ncbi:MAG: hypothetical protein JW828_16190 [Sedimentisphaerales bacterium]|nr:hypothetical protein [Sedimentisphaerales bacterium]
MKRFVWRLQRLLDMKVKQEDALRAELVAVTEQVVAVRGQMMMLRATLRRLLSELEDVSQEKWLCRKRLVLDHSQVTEQTIRMLNNRLSELEQERKRKIKEVMEVRKFRKSLEKLRTKALEQHTREQEKWMQNELDERTAIRRAREILIPG